MMMGPKNGREEAANVFDLLGDLLDGKKTAGDVGREILAQTIGAEDAAPAETESPGKPTKLVSLPGGNTGRCQ